MAWTNTVTVDWSMSEDCLKNFNLNLKLQSLSQNLCKVV